MNCSDQLPFACLPSLPSLPNCGTNSSIEGGQPILTTTSILGTYVHTITCTWMLSLHKIMLDLLEY